MSNKTVVLGLSGGVDSAVCAYLLKKQGYNVIGVFMQNWDSYVNNELNMDVCISANTCDPSIDWSYCKKIGELLDFPVHKVMFISDYWNDVFLSFIEQIKQNITPNPDVLCNQKIKFGKFIDYVKQNFKCDYIAMGHYAGVEHINNNHYLLQHSDTNKDQSYFLCTLTNKQLNGILFPIYGLNKKEVREIAKKANLPNADKKDSTGICFIGERNMKQFLSNYIIDKPGKIIDITTNKIVGDHIGLMFYTIGQRKGVFNGGMNQKYFVCKKDIKNNILYIAPNDQEKKYLFVNTLESYDFNWIKDVDLNKKIYARFRHRQELQKINILEKNDKYIKISFEPQKNVTIGQIVALYQDGYCLGGGIIKNIKLN